MKINSQPIKYIRIPDACFYCPATGWAVGLEEHHLFRGSQRSQSPSVYLCNKDHRKATYNKEFEIRLQKMYLEQYEAGKFKEGTIAGFGSEKYNPKHYVIKSQN